VGLVVMGRSANCQFGRFFPHKRRHRSSETPPNVQEWYAMVLL